MQNCGLKHPGGTSLAAMVGFELGNSFVELVANRLRIVGAGTVKANTSSTSFGGKGVLVWQMGAKLDVEDLARQCAPYSLKLRKVLGEDGPVRIDLAG